MNSDRKTANAVGGKTVRACDSCLRKRARWFCAADDAFLCQGCDLLVHSANQLASRHERVRLRGASFKASELKTLENDDYVPAWHQGFTRKARTPRHPKPALKGKERDKIASPLVPEMESEDSMFEETETELLYRVPVFDPFDAELCNVLNETKDVHVGYRNEANSQNETNILFSDGGNEETCNFDNLPSFLPSCVELAEFAVDVESLLGTEFEEKCCDMEGLGLIDCKEETNIDQCFEGGRVKVENEDEKAIKACCLDSGLDISRETLDWNFDYESQMTVEDEEDDKVMPLAAKVEISNGEMKEIGRKKLLRLNYEEVVLAWDNQGCPWTSGIRPQFNPDDCWPNFMSICSPGAHNPNGGDGGRMGGTDDGREARVLRYREKRRTRLFSKKIRYEVRKLNAEKRPRMKGRFVKRTSLAGGSTFPFLMNK